MDHNASELYKLEVKYKFLYFLKDIGIKSAAEPAKEASSYYMWVIGEIAKQGVS